MPGAGRGLGALPGPGEVAERLYGLPASGINWPSLSKAVLGRRGERSEVVGRLAEMLESAARAGREVDRCHAMINAIEMIAARERAAGRGGRP